MGRHTLTGLLATSGRQFCDWSADYRLFSEERFDPDRLFSVVLDDLLEQLPEDAPLVAAMDDSILHKTGTRIPGVGDRRDPLGPPFRTNFIRGQRVLQISAALPEGPRPSAARMIPLAFKQAPTPKKPRRTDPPEAWCQYRKAQRDSNISLKGAEGLKALRSKLDRHPWGSNRELRVVVDGGYTNRTVMRNLPENTTLIGRTRKDTKLYHLPEEDSGPRIGRKVNYGERAPTPEEFQTDPSVPWQTVEAWATGKSHQFKVKSLGSLRWRTIGPNRDLRLVVIAPLAYRLRKHSRVLYRKPAYLLCTDPGLSLEEILQSYLWRWDIEVNFRDEKQLIGVGEAQVRKEASVEGVPAFQVASYAMLLLSAHKAFKDSPTHGSLPSPKWRRRKGNHRASTQDLINHLRAELWSTFMGMDSFSGFRSSNSLYAKPKKLRPSLDSAVLYATG